MRYNQTDDKLNLFIDLLSQVTSFGKQMTIAAKVQIVINKNNKEFYSPNLAYDTSFVEAYEEFLKGYIKFGETNKFIYPITLENTKLRGFFAEGNRSFFKFIKLFELEKIFTFVVASHISKIPYDQFPEVKFLEFNRKEFLIFNLYHLLKDKTEFTDSTSLHDLPATNVNNRPALELSRRHSLFSKKDKPKKEVDRIGKLKCDITFYFKESDTVGFLKSEYENLLDYIEENAKIVLENIYADDIRNDDMKESRVIDYWKYDLTYNSVREVDVDVIYHTKPAPKTLKDKLLSFVKKPYVKL
ncbi:hypothetical protein [Carp edema virus]|nr:hypothetical protein [Carp edema virus]